MSPLSTPTPKADRPLVVGGPDRIFALCGARRITVGEFLATAARLASRLPDRPYVINLCESRYSFALSFAAAILRGQISLLPSNRAPVALDRLASRYPGAYRLGDEDLAELECGLHGIAPVSIPDEQTVAIVFTSGSTGEPQAHHKTWQIYSDSARLIADSLGIAPFSETALVATVPPQHMYGLELSVLLPLCHGGILVEAKPFFPADIRATLEAVPAPRQLVTTPVHLRALVESGESFPTIEGIVSATAPLPTELAERAEALMNCPVQEIYGCSEAGSLARRRTTESDVWQAFPGVRFGDGVVEAEHLPRPVAIGDIIEPLEPTGFRLQGRSTDLVNIAGKRSSLGALTHALLEIEGVEDGAFFQSSDDVHSRLVAIAVAPGMGRKQLLQQLRARLDPVFLPRPLYLVDRLPRSETGKLTRQAFDEFLARRNPGSKGDPGES